MFILPLPFIAPLRAVREGFICASLGHLSREQVTRFSRRFFRVPAKWYGNSGMTLAMLHDAKLRAYKPDRTGSERIICIKAIMRDKNSLDICVNEDF